MTVVLLGEALGVLRTAEVGSLAHAGSMLVGTGGAELNVAIGLVRLGTAARWVGRVGDDGLGRRVLRDLRGEGVAVQAEIDPEAPTGLLLKETPGPGRTRVTYHRAGSAGSRLSPADVARIDFHDVALLHVTGITPALSPTAAAAARAAVEAARAAGTDVSFDVNHRSRLWRGTDPADAYRWLAERADLVFAGEEEARLLVPDADDDLAAALTRLGPTTAVVKEGDRGASSFSPRGAARLPALPAAVVDTVGAGDAFVAGYLAEHLAGGDDIACLALAVAAGASACEHPGDWEGTATRAELAARRTGGDPVSR